MNQAVPRPNVFLGQPEFDATIASGHTTEEVVGEALSVIEALRRQPPTEQEITRTKNRIEWGHVRQMANVGGFGGRANRLNSFNVFAGDPGLVNTDIQRYLSVQAEDVHRVANGDRDRYQRERRGNDDHHPFLP